MLDLIQANGAIRSRPATDYPFEFKLYTVDLNENLIFPANLNYGVPLKTKLSLQ
jgi:hypothetical protein